jgi:plasmid maintenance system antidote protein VapI
MTISDLARALGIKRPAVSSVINGTRRSPKTEERISAYFGLPRQKLFPPRTKSDLEAMRQAAADKERAA